MSFSNEFQWNALPKDEKDDHFMLIPKPVEDDKI